MPDNPLRGIVTAMVTVFTPDLEVDLEGSSRLARYLVDNGSEGLVVAGTTGESPTLDDQEKLQLLDAVLEEVGNEVPVVLATGSNDTRHTVTLTAAAHRGGAHGALVVTPYYNKPNRAGIRAHYEAVAEASPDIPIVLYNIPARVIVNIEPDFLAELGEIPSVVAVKQANDDQIVDIEGIDLLAGNDSGFLPALEAGGVGGILVASHLAGARMGEVRDRWEAGDADEARNLDQALTPAYEAMTVTVNPIPVKAALEMAGVCNGALRLPLVGASQDERSRIAVLLEAGGVSL
jgi:4-hydroxy-tetrahydrodipicolinate synthase